MIKLTLSILVIGLFSLQARGGTGNSWCSVGMSVEKKISDGTYFQTVDVHFEAKITQDAKSQIITYPCLPKRLLNRSRMIDNNRSPDKCINKTTDEGYMISLYRGPVDNTDAPDLMGVTVGDLLKGEDILLLNLEHGVGRTSETDGYISLSKKLSDKRRMTVYVNCG